MMNDIQLGGRVTQQLLELSGEMEAGKLGLTAVILSLDIDATQIENDVRRLFPHDKIQSYFSPTAQTVITGLLLGIEVLHHGGIADKVDVAANIQERLSPPSRELVYPNYAHDFLVIGGEALEDTGIMPQLIPADPHVVENDMFEYHVNAFGFAISAAQQVMV